MNILEKAIDLFSPEWAYKRAVYRKAKREYEAAKVDRYTDTWMPITGDTENLEKGERQLIMARGRYLEKNSDVALGGVKLVVNNAVGTGIRPQARTDAESLNEKIEKAWEQWTQPENCDITGQQTFYEMQQMALRRKIVDGEAFVKKVSRKRDGIPFELQFISPDLLDTSLTYAPKTSNIIRSGIELDDYLKPLAYWIIKKSPDGYLTFDSDRYPADGILHLWTKEYPDQIRGISDLVTSMRRIKDTDDYIFAEQIAARIAASFAVFITNSIPPTRLGRQMDGNKKPLNNIAPGMVYELENGQSIQTANPSRNPSQIEGFVNVEQRITARGQGLSYEAFTGDYSKSSFSAARQGQTQDMKTYVGVQKWVVSHFCKPVYESFMDAAVMSGALVIRDYWSNREKYLACDWIAPGWDWIDPQKEASADIMKLKNAGMTLSDWCASRGKDWRTQLKQMAVEKAEAESLGLKLSIHTPETVQAAEANHSENDDKETENGE